jgi:hypothetical protein
MQTLAVQYDIRNTRPYQSWSVKPSQSEIAKTTWSCTGKGSWRETNDFALFEQFPRNELLGLFSIASGRRFINIRSRYYGGE